MNDNLLNIIFQNVYFHHKVFNKALSTLWDMKLANYTYYLPKFSPECWKPDFPLSYMKKVELKKER